MTYIVHEPGVACETKIEVLASELIELPVVQAIHAKRVNRFDFVAFRSQRGDELPGQILVEQNLHAAWRSLR